MRISIHDLPIKYPTEGVSFHAIPEAREGWIDRIWWDGEVLELVTVKGEVWRLDFETHSWTHTETVGVAAELQEINGLWKRVLERLRARLLRRQPAKPSA